MGFAEGFVRAARRCLLLFLAGMIAFGGALAKAALGEATEQVARYDGAGIGVEVTRHLVEGTTCYVARVDIASASQLRTAAAYSFERAQTALASAIAKRVNAVLAINGDYYSCMGGGYMIREGIQYRAIPMEGRDVLLIDRSGDFIIERAATAQTLAKYEEADILHSFNFGPGLVVDGELLGEYTAKFNASQKKRQRSCIAQVARGELSYLCISCEGPVESENGGLTMAQFASFVHGLGVENAYNLDGGDSSALIFQGEKLNAAGNSNHRAISDILYFAEMGEGDAP